MSTVTKAIIEAARHLPPEQLIELLRLALTTLARRGLATPDDLRLLAELRPAGDRERVKAA